MCVSCVQIKSNLVFCCVLNKFLSCDWWRQVFTTSQSIRHYRYCYLPLSRQVAAAVWQIPDAVNTVVCAPDDGWRYHPKHVEQFPDINQLCVVASCWMYIRIKCFIIWIVSHFGLDINCPYLSAFSTQYVMKWPSVFVSNCKPPPE